MTNEAADAVEEFDIVVIGAGISGIGAAAYFRRELADKSLIVLEGRDAIGGTWDLFRYPGIRSDSDLHTFGYEFKPWRHENAIADGPLILDYLHETVVENALAGLIRTGHRVQQAEWSSTESKWTPNRCHDGRRHGIVHREDDQGRVGIRRDGLLQIRGRVFSDVRRG